jgi:hypothetical protein
MQEFVDGCTLVSPDGDIEMDAPGIFRQYIRMCPDNVMVIHIAPLDYVSCHS